MYGGDKQEYERPIQHLLWSDYQIRCSVVLSLESRNKQSASVKAAEEVSLGGADPASKSRLLCQSWGWSGGRRSESIRAVVEELWPLVSVCLRVLWPLNPSMGGVKEDLEQEGSNNEEQESWHFRWIRSSHFIVSCSSGWILPADGFRKSPGEREALS